MKALLLCFIIALTFNANATEISKPLNFPLAKNYNDKFLQDTTLAYLLSLNLTSFEQQPVDSLLAKLPSNYIRRTIIGMGNYKVANTLLIIYPNYLHVVIKVKNFTHMNPRAPFAQWDINLFKLEKIKCTEIWDGAVLKSAECNLWD